MLSDKTAKRITERLDGNADNFIRDASLFGLNHAIDEFHLEDFPFSAIYDWAQERTDKKLLSARGLLHSPADGDTRYMEDFLTVVLKRFSQYEERVKVIEAENEQLRQAIKYHRAHPLDSCHNLMEKITNENPS